MALFGFIAGRSAALPEFAILWNTGWEPLWPTPDSFFWAVSRIPGSGASEMQGRSPARFVALGHAVKTKLY
jgi:hypothetical protein